MQKNRILCFIAGLFLAGSFSTCTKNAKNKNCEPFINIASGSHGCYAEKQEKIIISQEEWESYIMPCIKHFSEIEIDFEQHQVVIVTDEMRPSTGWSIAITCMTEHIDKIVVTVQVYAAKGTNLDVLTRPYHIVKMPITQKSIEFEYFTK